MYINDHKFAAILNLLHVSSNKLSKCSSDSSLYIINYILNYLVFFS